MPRYTYKDFVTGKLRYTCGQFAGWTQPTGLLSVPYAIFARRSDTLLVPKYLLTRKTLALLDPTEESGEPS